jgi:glycosyltransferase involved in cell wall biosynthesis
MTTLYFVIPCYNEQEVLPETVKRLNQQIQGLIDTGKVSDKSRMIFVDDGSHDKTWEMISKYSIDSPYVCGLKLSRNCGHQNALLAGLMVAKDFADCVISLDADLQDDMGVIPEFIDKFYDGCDVVYGVRKCRATDTWFKRNSAQGFYKIMQSMGVKVVDNHADYRLMSRRALESLSEFHEVNLFLRGIVPLLGFKSANVYYDRNERFAGESKYPLKKMIAFAVDGITSFSITPIRFITGMGFVFFIISLFVLLYALISKLTGNTQAGWTTIIGSIWFIGGVQLLSLGICGEYIGKIYKEVKARPHYIIDKVIIK